MIEDQTRRIRHHGFLAGVDGCDSEWSQKAMWLSPWRENTIPLYKEQSVASDMRSSGRQSRRYSVHWPHNQVTEEVTKTSLSYSCHNYDSQHTEVIKTSGFNPSAYVALTCTCSVQGTKYPEALLPLRHSDSKEYFLNILMGHAFILQFPLLLSKILQHDDVKQTQS